ERPDFFALAVDEKNGAAVGAGLARSDLQNDVDEFAEVECGVQALGGFDDAGELFHGAAALGQSQNNSGETREVVELSAELVVQDAFAGHFENSHTEIVAAKGGGPKLAVVGRIDDRAGDGVVVAGWRQDSGGSPDAGVAAVNAPEARANNIG